MATTKQMERFFKALGKRIADRRREVGLTQTDLANAIGCSQQLVAHYEAGRRKVPASSFKTIGEVLGLTLHEIMGEEPPKETAQKRGPPSKLQKQMKQVAKLPRAKQQVVMEVVEGLLQRYQTS